MYHFPVTDEKFAFFTKLCACPSRFNKNIQNMSVAMKEDVASFVGFSHCINYLIESCSAHLLCESNKTIC